MKLFSFRSAEADRRREAELMSSIAEAMSDLTESVISPGDVDLAMDDRGWLKFAGSTAAGEFAVANRRATVLKSRLYWHRDPLVKQAVRVWTDYAINTGCTFQVTDDKDAVTTKTDRASRIASIVPKPTPTKEADPLPNDGGPSASKGEDAEESPEQELLEKFWSDRRNRAITSVEGQRKSSKKLLVDGELFFALWDLQDGKVIRRIDPLEITDLIKDPDDSELVLAFRRQYMVNDTTKVKYYRNLLVTDDEFSVISALKGPQNEAIVIDPKDPLVYHVAFDSLKDRGNPLCGASLDWAREHRRFMESRIAIVQALAKFAHKLTAKGGQKQLDAIKKAMASSFTTSIGTGIEKNPAPNAGSTWLQNEAVSLEAMPRSTGATDSIHDGDQIKLMHCASTGVMLHYFGDPQKGNLATATAMELPMLKQFEAYQAQWGDIWCDIFSWVLDEDPLEENKTPIDVDYPPIVVKDINVLAQSIVNFTTAFPELKVEPVIALILTALGINNLDEVLDMIELKSQEVQAQQQQQAQQQHEQAMALIQAKQAAPPPKNVAEALDNLIQALESTDEK